MRIIKGKNSWNSRKGGYWTIDVKDDLEEMDTVIQQNKYKKSLVADMVKDQKCTVVG